MDWVQSVLHPHQQLKRNLHHLYDLICIVTGLTEALYSL